MNRRMLLAAVLFDPHRTSYRIEIHRDGTIDECGHITPGQIARLKRERPDLVAIVDRMRGEFHAGRVPR